MAKWRLAQQRTSHQADFGVILPRVSLVATIALAYSIISPVINGLAMLSFMLLWVAWKFLFTWVFDQPDAGETGGLYVSYCSPYLQPAAYTSTGVQFRLALSNLCELTPVLSRPVTNGSVFAVVGLYIEHICLAGLFFLATDAQGRRSAIPQGVLMIVLLAMTLAANIFLVKAYGRELTAKLRAHHLISVLSSHYPQPSNIPHDEEDTSSSRAEAKRNS